MKHQGFSLLELLITLVVVALLTAIALPGYGAIMRHAQRNDARLALLGIAHDEEVHYQSFDAYTERLTQPRDLGGLGLAIYSTAGHYRLAIQLRSGGQGFVASARPVAQDLQAADDSCALFTLDESGKRTAADAHGRDTTDPCWR